MPEESSQSEANRTERHESPAGLKPETETPGSSQPVLWNQKSVLRFLGMGTELAGFTLFVAGIGYVLDSVGEYPRPYGTAFGALLGFTLGMVRFIRQARKTDD